ncbi:hypothetical protein D5F01_LYC19975 [Larimichthys crocea]|uniref:LINE-1 type transposase domain-containing protein 1 n=1 Tax=Larimichthys crocea TaxID=215358 RepID=A0A0F8CLX8_LARCR|nr:hypothetical protein D5F01_LYC19975 [Larimichthys crocea]
MPRSTKNLSKKTPANVENEGEPSVSSGMPSADANSGSMESDIVQALDRITDNLTKAVVARVGEAEKRIADVEAAATSSEARLAYLEKQVHDVREHIDDLNNRGRRCNIRIVGLPEGSEGSDSVKFFERCIPEFLQMDTKAGRLKLDRAHRSLALKPGTGQCPRPLIVKFHNFTDKQRVMEAACRLGSRRSNQEDPTHKEPRISFFNDYSVEVVWRCKAFDDIKAQLRKMNMDYALLCPDTLKVMVNGTQRRFDTPKEAASLLHSLEQRCEDTASQ